MKILILFFLSFSALAVDNTLLIENEHGKIIRGGTYSSSTGNCITINNSTDVIIQDATFIDCWLNGVSINQSVSVTVTNSYFERTGGGIYALDSANIKVTGNKAKHTMRRVGSARGQFVQFNKVYGDDNLIAWNHTLDENTVSTREDAINIHESYFPKYHPLVIKDNVIQGSGSSGTACGIIVNDGGGAGVQVLNNKLYNPGNCGIGVAGGTLTTVDGNMVYSAQFPYTQIGLYVSKKPPTSTLSCAGIIVNSNNIDWTRNNGTKNSHWVDQTTCPGSTNTGQINNQNLSGMVLPVF